MIGALCGSAEWVESGLDLQEMNLKWNLLYCHLVLRLHFCWLWG